MRRICDCLQRMHFRICGVYLLESQFIEDNSKFFAGVMSAMSAMISLEIPHINVLSKMDLLGKVKKQELERFKNHSIYSFYSLRHFLFIILFMI